MLELWYQALHEKMGIKVQTDNVEGLRQKLYSARRTANDPQLAELSIQLCPTNPTGEIWIMHKTIKRETPDAKE